MNRPYYRIVVHRGQQVLLEYPRLSEFDVSMILLRLLRELYEDKDVIDAHIEVWIE